MSKTQPNIIQVTNLTKKYGDLIAVDSVSFNVAEGAIFAFLGPNGAGKSTTIKMLTTVLTPTSGKIVINGYDPILKQDLVRKSFGIVFQDPSLDDELTALENMQLHAVLYQLPRSLSQHRIEELLEFVHLADRKNNLVKTFSGGMKRRLEIARGLLHHPKILFLDEPTLGLDPQTRQSLWSYLQSVNKAEKMTVFFTTHYMEEAEKIAHHIAIIDQGKIISQGTAVNLKDQTKTTSLEEAFLKLTGNNIREEEASGVDRMRMRSRVWGGRR
ncbi:ATP-binding cassette domain-containing protein [Patescibacteria group bacterium]|nr:ATP-binding cassette domain-containing protein [Patescibacteria group bacterium]